MVEGDLGTDDCLSKPDACPGANLYLGSKSRMTELRRRYLKLGVLGQRVRFLRLLRLSVYGSDHFRLAWLSLSLNNTFDLELMIFCGTRPQQRT